MRSSFWSMQDSPNYSTIYFITNIREIVRGYDDNSFLNYIFCWEILIPYWNNNWYKSVKVLIYVILAKFILKLLLQVLLRQLLIRILLDQNWFLQIIHNLQDQYQFLLPIQLHPLQIWPNYLSSSRLQLAHLVFSIFIDRFSDQEDVGFYAIDFFLYCCFELSERVLTVWIRWGLFF